jgi:glutathione synthase/RimK-type ligase-like ATP-grasp enzyme
MMRAGHSPHIALVTARDALTLDQDLPLLARAVDEAGASASMPVWDDPTVDWSRFDLAVLRSTWDYCERIDEFLDWSRRCAAQTRFLNAPDLVRWNVDKHYLVDLSRNGVPVVPSRYVEPEDDPLQAVSAFLDGSPPALHAGRIDRFDQFVVKPAIGAGSRDAARYRRGEREQALAHVARLNAAGRSVLLQPYLERIDDGGETAMMFLGGQWSHAIRKGPLLRLGAGMVVGLYVPEQITSRTPDAAEAAVAAAAHAAIPGPVPPYARIDLIRDDHGAPVVLELELCEPSLYLAHWAASAPRFARLLIERATG